MTNRIQIVFANPPRSLLRKMSANTRITSMIHMMNRKNQIIDQKTSSNPNASMGSIPFNTSARAGALRVLNLGGAATARITRNG